NDDHHRGNAHDDSLSASLKRVAVQPVTAWTALSTPRTVITSPASRVIQTSGIQRNSCRPPRMAKPPTAHRPRVAPIATASRSWYFAARLAMAIWVRSPNSATNSTPKLVLTAVQNPARRVVGWLRVLVSTAPAVGSPSPEM